LKSDESINDFCNYTVSLWDTRTRQHWRSPFEPPMSSPLSTSETTFNLQPFTKTSTRRFEVPEVDVTVPSPAEVTETPVTCRERSSALRYAATTFARRLLIATCEATEPALLV